jgi:2-polyprenyl-6-methoxyphenol hydroxylase-like FAD-dependent oxidoreductase
MKTEVIIIGAGPTGLALGCHLIRLGVDFVIIDKKETTTPHSKAIGVQARTLEIYEQIGLADDLISRGAITEKARFVEGGEVRGEASLKDIGKGMSAYPFLLIVEQGEHEKLLYDFIKARGKDVQWNTELVDFAQDDSAVTTSVKRASGEIETIEGKYLVACDGAKSLVRHKLGIEFGGSTFERLFYVADVQIDWNFSHDALYACLAQHTLTAFFPMPGENRFRIVGTFPEGHEGEEGEVLYEEIEQQIIADTDIELDISHVNWFSVYKVHSRAVEKFSEKKIFLAGDAAHIHTPAGAQGMNTGIQDGYNLAWKLNLVTKGKASEKILDTYDEERLENARRLLQTTDRFFQLGASPEWFVSFFRTHIFPYVANFALSLDVVKRAIFPLVSQIGINYRHSSLSDDKAGLRIKAGDRMPYFEIDGASIYDRLREPMFHLIVFSDGKESDLKLENEFVNKYDGLLDTNTFPLYPDIVRKFENDSSFFLLLRPDNYIGLISSGNSTEEVAMYLDKILK